MRNWLTSLQPNPWLTRKMVMLAILVGVGMGAFFLGRRQQVQADGPNRVAASPGHDTKEYYDGVVAYLYEDNLKVTRAELGEYLIARFGGERLEFLVNRKIVEIECYKRNIIVTDAEVEHRFKKDLQAFGAHITEHDFVNSILRRFGKTLYEWKEDVIRPKLMMEKLVRPMVQITDKDVREGFEARYGPKVECRMIVVDGKTGPKAATDVYEIARRGRKEFLEEAGKQFIPNLRETQGKVPPIHKFFGDRHVEEAAFELKVGEISRPLLMEDKTYVIMYCEQHLPADTKFRYEQERMKLEGEMFELRLAQKIPEEFTKLRERANPRKLLATQEARGTLPPIQPPMQAPNPSSQPTPRTDIAPLVPTPVTAPAGSGIAPLSNAVAPLPPVVLPTQPPSLAQPAVSGIAPTEKK